MDVTEHSAVSRKRALKIDKTSLKYEAFVSLRESFLSPILHFFFTAFSLTDAEVPMEY